MAFTHQNFGIDFQNSLNGGLESRYIAMDGYSYIHGINDYIEVKFKSMNCSAIEWKYSPNECILNDFFFMLII